MRIPSTGTPHCTPRQLAGHVHKQAAGRPKTTTQIGAQFRAAASSRQGRGTVQQSNRTRPLWEPTSVSCLQRWSRTCRAATAARDGHADLADKASNEQLLQRLLTTPLPELMAEAAALRDAGHRAITFSPKVFIPLTRLCRDSCGYCTFALPPTPGRRAYMTLEEVVQVARLGQEQGCTEALFTLGDKPELLYSEAASELAAMGYATTLDYVHAAAEAVLQETGLVPHINAGVMSRQELERLKQVSASQGLMLESTSERLMQPGGPHHGCPDKEPTARLATLEAAGQAGVPFTSGILVGIGETRRERLEALVAIAQVHQRYGHIQEIIVQNFRAKKGTAMAQHPEPSLDELLWSIACARIIFGPAMTIQAPPNLTPVEEGQGPVGQLEGSWRALLDAGINDWGGISPITRDFVNPEKPWPHLSALTATTAAAGLPLLPRLPIYPAYALELSGRWLHDGAGKQGIGAAVRRHMDSSGLVRGSGWCPGQVEASGMEAAEQPPEPQLHHAPTSPLDDPPVNEAAARTSGIASTSSSGGSSIPLPRKQAKRLWRVAMSDTGTLEGFPSPAPSQQIQQLLDRILAGSNGANSSTNNSMDPTNCGTNGSTTDTQAFYPDGTNSSIATTSNSSSSSRASSYEPSLGDVELLLSARGADMEAVCRAADLLRQHVCGDEVSYVVNRNINYTNVCTYKCQFCAFSKGKAAEALRGPSYTVPLQEISRRTAEAWQRGATEVCMQGGIHPDFTGKTYLSILAAAKDGAPDIHVHAFSPLEVMQGAQTLGLPVSEYLAMLRDAGLGSLPGTAAEVLDDSVRAVLCPDKLSTAEWLQVVEAAHGVGLRTTSTIMFGHVDSPTAWARHLLALRNLQARTGGITEFVPLPFVHMEAPIYLKGKSRRGPTQRECIVMHAVARLVLHPHITNIQASWVKMGPERAAALLAAGCNDMGGSIMNESITKAAGAAHGQELAPHRMEALIRAAGRTPRQRTTLYGMPPRQQAERSFEAAAAEPLAPLVTAPGSAGMLVV